MAILQLSEYLGKFKDDPECDYDVLKNAQVILAKASELLSRAGYKVIKITSGFRPKSYNKQIGGSPTSKHCYGQAIDLWDPDKSLGHWCLENLNTLEELGLYMEDLSTTHKDPHRWVHLTYVAPKSGKRVFLP